MGPSNLVERLQSEISCAIQIYFIDSSPALWEVSSNVAHLAGPRHHFQISCPGFTCFTSPGWPKMSLSLEMCSSESGPINVNHIDPASFSRCPQSTYILSPRIIDVDVETDRKNVEESDVRCWTCGDLGGYQDSYNCTYLFDIEHSAGSGCRGCSLLRDAVEYCVPRWKGTRIGYLEWENNEFGPLLSIWKYSLPYKFLSRKERELNPEEMKQRVRKTSFADEGQQILLLFSMPPGLSALHVLLPRF